MSSVTVTQQDDPELTKDTNAQFSVSDTTNQDPQTAEYRPPSELEGEQVTESMKALESYLGILKAAGRDGISAQSGAVMQVHLIQINRQFGVTRPALGQEAFNTGHRTVMKRSTISLEDIRGTFSAGLQKLIDMLKRVWAWIQEKWDNLRGKQEQVEAHTEYLKEVFQAMPANDPVIPPEEKLPAIPEGLKSRIPGMIAAANTKRGDKVAASKANNAAARLAEAKAAEEAKRNLDVKVKVPNNPLLWISDSPAVGFMGARPDRDLGRKIAEEVLPAALTAAKDILAIAKGRIRNTGAVEVQVSHAIEKHKALLQGFTVTGSNGIMLQLDEGTLNMKFDNSQYAAKPSDKEVSAKDHGNMDWNLQDCQAWINRSVRTAQENADEIQKVVKEMTAIVEGYDPAQAGEGEDGDELVAAYNILLQGMQKVSNPKLPGMLEHLLNAVEARNQFSELCLAATLQPT